MKRIFTFIFVIVSIFVLNICNVKAFSLSTSSQTVYVGETVYIYADTTGIYGNVPAYSSDSDILAGGNIIWADKYPEKNTIYSFTSKSPGTAVITVGGGEDVYYDNNTECHETRSIIINVISRPTYTEPIEVNRTYSSNNYLSGLAVEGYSIIPEFDKEVLEYSMEVDYNVTKVNIQAALEDDAATVTGTGEQEVEEGKNTFIIKVTAENGNEREYILNVLVKELNPTNVKVNQRDYTLVKKEDKLPELDNYVKSTVKIDGVEVPALKGKITKYTIVGLKDEKGNINLYIYDAKNNKYTPYNEIKFANVSLYYMENSKNNYKKTTIKINGKEVVAYKKSGLDYYLIYGMNLNTGKVNWYTYDKEEGTIQKYTGSNKSAALDNNSYLVLVYSLTGISGLLILFMMILSIKYKKKMN